MNIKFWVITMVFCSWTGSAGAKDMTPGDIMDLDFSDPDGIHESFDYIDLKFDDLERVELSDPHMVVKTFVDLEFKGVHIARHHFAQFTHDSMEEKRIIEREEISVKLGGCPGDLCSVGRILDDSYDDLFVVSRYKILSVDIDGNHGTATIDYDRLASTARVQHERKIFVDRKDHDLVTMELRKKNNEWHIINPPLWRISVDAIHNGYRWLKKEWGCIPLNDRKKYNSNEIDECKIIKHLKANRRKEIQPLTTQAPKCRKEKATATAVMIANTTPPGFAAPIHKRDLSDPQQVVNMFVEDEFKGLSDVRLHMARFSPNSKEMQNVHELEQACIRNGCSDCATVAQNQNKILDIFHDEWFAVGHYNIQHVKTEGNHGVAEVDFVRLISTKRGGSVRRMFADKIAHDQITLNLIREDGQWFIVDPPPWRIDHNKVSSKYYKAEKELDLSYVETSLDAPKNDPFPSHDPESLHYQLNHDLHTMELLKNIAVEYPEEIWVRKSRHLAAERRRMEEDKKAWEKTDQELRAAATPKPPALPPVMPGGQPGKAQEKSTIWHDPKTGMTFIWIPGSTFWMGCGSWVSECFGDEKPVHLVTLDGFWLSAYEVTQAQWQAVMGSNPALFQDRDYGQSKKNMTDGDEAVMAKRTDPAFLNGKQNHPVEKINFDQVQDFIKKLNSQGGEEYRLPTEAEWEYACRAGDAEDRYAGGSDLSAVAWHAYNSEDTTHVVGTRQANRFGLFDMTGNVSEWMQDHYSATAYAHHARQNPLVSEGNNMVIRGGSFQDRSRRFLRCLYRGYRNPSEESYANFGFRLALTPSGGQKDAQ
ncbi:MAG: formylglycine-generating enzyme family protein [Magnetococcales bacterium]|nr:formylglycine-generating enzyme family protein [Magnetococcales bacterium]